MSVPDPMRVGQALPQRKEAPALPTQVIKRDGQRAPFELAKIASAIARAGAATGEFDGAKRARWPGGRPRARAPARRRRPRHRDDPGLRRAHARRAPAGSTPRAPTSSTATATQRLRADRKTLVDVAASVDEYLEQKDWRVNANANQGYSLGGLILNVSGKVVANYWLSHVYPPEIGRAHRDGDLHIHDLDMLAGYCAGWSLRQLLHEGLNGVPGKVEARTAEAHVAARSGRSSTSSARCRTNGRARRRSARSTRTWRRSSARTAMTYDAVKQCIQELIYNLNVPSRWGTQTPFTNLTFDWVCPEDLREQIPVIAGGEMPLHATATCSPRWT